MRDLLLFAGVFALSAATPGPDTMLVFGRALGGSASDAIPYALGLVVGKLLLLSLAVLGVTAAAAALGPLFVAVKITGAAYLIWLGVRMLRRTATADLPPEAKARRTSFVRASAVGAGLTVSNPQAILFYVAVLPQVLDPGRPTLPEYLALCGALVLIMAVITAFYIALAAGLRGAAPTGVGRRRTDRAAGLLMIVAGGVVAAR